MKRKLERGDIVIGVDNLNAMRETQYIEFKSSFDERVIETLSPDFKETA